MYSPVLTKFSPIPINTQHPNPILAQHQGTESHQGSSQLESATSQLILPSSGFCGKSTSTASLGTPSPAFVTAQVTPTTAFRQGRTDPRGARTSRDPSLSQEPSQPWGHSGSRRAWPCPTLTLLTPKAVTEDTVSDKATTWHRKGWKPTTFPHVPFLSTVPVSLSAHSHWNLWVTRFCVTSKKAPQAG